MCSPEITAYIILLLNNFIMNKKELLQKADELVAKANELKELANKEESNVILVPDNIQIISRLLL